MIKLYDHLAYYKNRWKLMYFGSWQTKGNSKSLPCTSFHDLHFSQF